MRPHGPCTALSRLGPEVCDSVYSGIQNPSDASGLPGAPGAGMGRVSPKAGLQGLTHGQLPQEATSLTSHWRGRRGSTAGQLLPGQDLQPGTRQTPCTPQQQPCNYGVFSFFLKDRFKKVKSHKDSYTCEFIYLKGQNWGERQTVH